MIQYIIAAGIGAFLGSRSKKSKKSYAHGGEIYKVKGFRNVKREDELDYSEDEIITLAVISKAGKGENESDIKSFTDAKKHLISEGFSIDKKDSTYAKGGKVETVEIGDTIKVSDDWNEMRMQWNDEYADDLTGKTFIVDGLYYWDVHKGDRRGELTQVWAEVSVPKKPNADGTMNDPKGYKISPHLFKITNYSYAKGGSIKVGDRVKYPKAKNSGKVKSIRDLGWERELTIEYDDGKIIKDGESSVFKDDVVPIMSKEYINPDFLAKGGKTRKKVKK